MKKTILLSIVIASLFVCIHCSNSHQANSNKQKDSSINKSNIGRPCNNIPHLMELGSSFKPTDLGLNVSLNKNTELNQFLDTMDETCLMKQHNYEIFIAVILVKQYYYHLSNAHQGYDLLSMRIGNASKIIHCFRKMANKEARMEMLNSGLITDYLKKNPQIRNIEINTYLNKIKNVNDSIEMEAYWEND